jgi:hypothetical protein
LEQVFAARAGQFAIAARGQRVVWTTNVICVGNHTRRGLGVSLCDVGMCPHWPANTLRGLVGWRGVPGRRCLLVGLGEFERQQIISGCPGWGR